MNIPNNYGYFGLFSENRPNYRLNSSQGNRDLDIIMMGVGIVRAGRFEPEESLPYSGDISAMNGMEGEILKKYKFGQSVVAEIEKQASEPDVPPRMLTAEDRNEFVGSLPRQYQSEAEIEFNRLVGQTEMKREEWFTRAVTFLTPLMNGSNAINTISIGRQPVRNAHSDVLTSQEAAAYLRHSTSWLLRQPDIAYIKSTPNLYRRVDLDDWLKRHVLKPRGI